MKNKSVECSKLLSHYLSILHKTYRFAYKIFNFLRFLNKQIDFALFIVRLYCLFYINTD